MTDNLEDLRRLDLPFDVDQVDPQCHRCVRNQIKKYAKYVDINGNPVGNRFLVNCTGVPLYKIDPAEEALLSDEDVEFTKAINDPVLFAKKFIIDEKKEPWIARPHQEEIIRCTAKNKVLRLARRLGKTESTVVDILYHAFVTPNLRILVLGPQKTHAQEIFNRMKDRLYANPFLASSVVTDKASPHPIIALKNGSEIRGFAGGSKGKTDGLSVRGQDGDRIYVDELSRVDEEAIRSAIMPIMYTNADAAFIGFSTPAPFKNTFYTLCKENPSYKEYHYTYKALDWWERIERDRSGYTEEQWANEFLATFSDADGGVYKPSYIERALNVYNYKECVPTPGWKYTMGVDWNEKHGAEIVVLGFDSFKRKYKIVEACNVTGIQFTQLASVNKVVEMNQKWKPKFIYVDVGNGSTNIELLLKMAYDAAGVSGLTETAMIRERLRKYDSGASIEVYDNTTKQMVKKAAKPFMVSCSVRMFEQDKVIISANDHVLTPQLENYIIERMTPTGNPVYGLEKGSVGDHRLDAFNLAIVAFQIHYSELHKREFVSNVGSAPDPRNVRLNEAGDVIGTAQRPETRDHGEDFMSIEEKQLAYSGAGRVDLKKVKTNRLGWDTDEEDARMNEYLQRKQARQVRGRSSFRERPNRPNI